MEAKQKQRKYNSYKRKKCRKISQGKNGKLWAKGGHRFHLEVQLQKQVGQKICHKEQKETMGLRREQFLSWMNDMDRETSHMTSNFQFLKEGTPLG